MDLSSSPQTVVLWSLIAKAPLPLVSQKLVLQGIKSPLVQPSPFLQIPVLLGLQIPPAPDTQLSHLADYYFST